MNIIIIPMFILNNLISWFVMSKLFVRLTFKYFKNIVHSLFSFLFYFFLPIFFRKWKVLLIFFNFFPLLKNKRQKQKEQGRVGERGKRESDKARGGKKFNVWFEFYLKKVYWLCFYLNWFNEAFIKRSLVKTLAVV